MQTLFFLLFFSFFFTFSPQFMGIQGEISLAAGPQDADHMLSLPSLPPSLHLFSWWDQSLNVHPSYPSFEANASGMSSPCPHFLSSREFARSTAAEFKAWTADLQQKLGLSRAETLGVAISLHPWQPVKPVFVEHR